MKGVTALHGAVSTLVGKTKPKTVDIPTLPSFHINWYTVGACFIVAAILISFFRRNKILCMFAFGVMTAVALKLGVHHK